MLRGRQGRSAEDAAFYDGLAGPGRGAGAQQCTACVLGLAASRRLRACVLSAPCWWLPLLTGARMCRRQAGAQQPILAFPNILCGPGLAEVTWQGAGVRAPGTSTAPGHCAVLQLVSR